MAKSSVITDKERAHIEARIEAGLTVEAWEGAYAWLGAEIPKRKAAEKEAAAELRSTEDVEEPASESQLNAVAELMHDIRTTPAERAGLKKMLDDSPTADRVASAINRVEKAIADRTDAAEQAAS
jgi:hypothetical protein